MLLKNGSGKFVEYGLEGERLGGGEDQLTILTIMKTRYSLGSNCMSVRINLFISQFPCL